MIGTVFIRDGVTKQPSEERQANLEKQETSRVTLAVQCAVEPMPEKPSRCISLDHCRRGALEGLGDKCPMKNSAQAS